MTGLRETKKRATRKAIITAAVQLFSEKGFEGTSMDELAKAAGVGKGTIYGYFQTKREIFMAFCEEELDYALDAVAEANDPDAPLLEQLVTLFMSQFDFVTANRDFGRIILREMMYPDEETADKSQELVDRYLTGVGEILDRATARGELKSDLSKLITIGHLYAIYNIAVHAWYANDLQSRTEVEVLLRSMLLQALNGLAPQPVAADIDTDVLNTFQQRILAEDE